MESIHWGLGSGLGALFGGFAYSTYGAVPLFQVCSLISLFSTALALIAAVQYGSDNPRTRNGDIEFTALPVALLDPVEDQLEESFKKNCEPHLPDVIGHDQEASSPAFVGLSSLKPSTKESPAALHEALGETISAPSSGVVRSTGNAAYYVPVSASETEHGDECVGVTQAQ